MTSTSILSFLLPAILSLTPTSSLIPPSASRAGATIKMAIDAPYGSWKSPISSKAITAGSVSLGSLHYCSNQLYWIEGRPQEAGRYVLCRYDPANDDATSERNGVDVTPKDSNVRTRVHEYGGASVTFGDDGRTIFYSEFGTQRLMKLAVPGTGTDYEDPVAITPEGGTYRFADGDYLSLAEDDGGGVLVMVREDHTNPAPKDVVNEVVSVATDGSMGMSVLATGNDFYAAPRLSPDGSKMAYVTWNHPNMPWDATELRVRDMTTIDGGDSASRSHELIAGDNDSSIIQPLWHPQTGDLFYISDKSGYYNIYRAGETESILPLEYDFGGSAPGWRLGQQGYSFLGDGRLAATYNKDGSTRLVVADVSQPGPATDVTEYDSSHGLPMQFGGVIPGEDNDTIYFMGGSPSTPGSIYKHSLSSSQPATEIARSSTLSFPSSYISNPRQIAFKAPHGISYGYYYPPTNGDYTCTTVAAPPLLVKAHGGPTACTSTTFNPTLQYWTSRGFAVFDVDYSGSTGYGRDYRRRLRKNWGVVDVEDVCAGAEYLVSEGLANGKQLCIDGGSAGGYTTLAALAFKNVFTAGCSLYGVADLEALAGDTHKFESRYLDGLVGPYPDEKELFEKRSPINCAEGLSCPILLLQGDEDKIVPPNQAQMMHEVLLKKGIKTCLKMYKGEQHGFRKAENIEDALDSELAFFGTVFGITVPDAVELDIDNL